MQESIPIGTKTVNPKIITLITNSSKCKETAQKEYVSKDPESDPSFSEPSSSNSDLSYDNKYGKSKSKICD